jgi:hypothetical protein
MRPASHLHASRANPSVTRTREATARPKVRALLDEHPEHVIVAHGEIARSNGEVFLLRTFSWLLQGLSARYLASHSVVAQAAGGRSIRPMTNTPASSAHSSGRGRAHIGCWRTAIRPPPAASAGLQLPVNRRPYPRKLYSLFRRQLLSAQFRIITILKAAAMFAGRGSARKAEHQKLR